MCRQVYAWHRVDNCTRHSWLVDWRFEYWIPSGHWDKRVLPVYSKLPSFFSLQIFQLKNHDWEERNGYLICLKDYKVPCHRQKPLHHYSPQINSGPIWRVCLQGNEWEKLCAFQSPAPYNLYTVCTPAIPVQRNLRQESRELQTLLALCKRFKARPVLAMWNLSQ